MEIPEDVKNEYRIEIATSEDIDAIYELELECFAIPWSYDSIKNDLTENPLAVLIKAIYQNNVIGYIGLWNVLDEGQITNLAVKKEYRSLGIGRALIKKVCEIAIERGVTQLSLEVRPSNIAAKKVYVNEGFEKVAIRKAYYQNNGEDAIIMLKKLE